MIYVSKGHTYYIDQYENYHDTSNGKIVKKEEAFNRACKACGKMSETCKKCPAESWWKDDHDYCLGHIDNIVGVCCGHGDIKEAYIAYQDGTKYYEKAAIDHFRENKMIRPKV